MKILTQLSDPELIAGLRSGRVVVIRTDTLYGLVASTAHAESIERLYEIKHRDPSKACVVLIGDESQVLAGTLATPHHHAVMARYWPGPVTIVVPVDGRAELLPIHRGVGSIGYRLPNSADLQAFLQATGPLVAPSANPEGLPPATTIQQAIDYFGDAIDFYVDSGQVTTATPSQIVRIGDDGQEQFLR